MADARSSAMRRSIDDGVVVDDNYVGGLMLWTVNGLLSSLEYYWVTDEMPSLTPPDHRHRGLTAALIERPPNTPESARTRAVLWPFDARQAARAAG